MIGGDDLHLVAEALGEARAQRAVGEATGEDGGLARPTLTTEDAAGDLARGVHALLDVDRQREEVDALTGLAGDDGAQDGGVAHPHEHRAVGLGSELAGLQGHLESGRIDRAGLHGWRPPWGTRSSLAHRRGDRASAWRFPVVAVRSDSDRVGSDGPGGGD